MFILASTSQARHKLLRGAGIIFEAHAPNTDESAFKQANQNLGPAQIAQALARAKAESLRAHFPNSMIVGCDQVLSCHNRMFDKPGSTTAALEQLSFLQGKTHTLHTALCCISPSGQHHEVISEPNLAMRALTRPSLEAYLEKAGPGVLSSVGCYHIEGLGVQLFDTVDGDLFSIQGLPLLSLLAFLRKHGHLAT